jgi:Zn-dependent protease
MGIRIGVDPSWFIVLFLVIWSLSGAYKDALAGSDDTAFALATVSALAFFTSVVLHELGHAWVARRNGIEIEGIDLWLFGGLAKLKGDSPTAGVEFRVAIAGPIVTFVIAAGCFGLASALASSKEVGDAILLDPKGNVRPGIAVLGWLTLVNTALLVFNLIPGFPLDGGRIVRAIAWWRTGDRLKATRVAAALGRGFAYAIGGLGVVVLFSGDVISGLWFAFIGYFLSQAAKAAEVQTAIASRLEGLKVADVMDTEPVAVPARMKLDQAHEEYFARYGWPWFPVTDQPGHFLGVLTQGKVEEVPERLRPEYTADQVMIGDPGRFRVSLDAPLDTLLSADGLGQLGAMLAVDRDGVLRGIVTADQVRRALQPAV